MDETSQAAFEEGRPPTIGQRGRRVWLYPKWFRGRFMTARTLAHAALVVLLLIGPWIDVGGNPAIRIDIPGRRIYFWGLQLFATDGSYLMVVFGTIVFAVFFFTALFGRAWCGWACPQTVFLESVIRPVERLIEGSPVAQRKLDEGPWNAEKLFKKGLKLGLYAVVCGALGTTAVAYFLGREGVMAAQTDPMAHPVGTAFFLAIAGLTFFDFAWFREQTCLVVCPYGRFQSVLLDANSLAVGYDATRGEPRGRKGTEGAGDCVDCKRCLHVCPTGIDIRNGSQMECVQCMACIDACDDVMERLHRPLGLIRFTSENGLERRPTRIVRPRVIAYGVGLVAMLVVGSFVMASHSPVEVAVSRQVGAPWAQLPDGRVQNAMQVRIANKGREKRAFTVAVESPPQGELITPISPFPVEPGAVAHMPVFLVLPPGHGPTPFSLRVEDDSGFQQTVPAKFLGPTGGTSP